MTLSIFIPIIILIGIILLISINSNKNKESETDNFDVLQKENYSTKNEIEDICSIVDSKYNRSTSKIILDPNEFKGLYEDISDLIEKTEVMVIEYLQQIREESKLYDYSWIYEGLNENKECVYKIIKKKNKNFVGNDDNNYINDIENLCIIIEYFMSNHKGGGYQFKDAFSGRWVQFAELYNNYYIAEIYLLDDDGNFIDDVNIMSNARKIFKEYEISEENVFRKNITNSPSEGALFLLDSFFTVFQLNRVKFSFKTLMNEEFENSKFPLDDLTFVFDRWHYLNAQRDEFINKNGLRDRFINTKSTSELPKKKRSRRISQDVKDKVWNRDGGKCVECGSNENLEFDHIIPHSKGGANTYRNIQLLCEPCNRIKSAKIG